jgi:uncharacterized protein YheU (UPF0270 family)
MSKGSTEKDSTSHMNIPYDQLDKNTLRSLIEEFVTRNGTDYGENEASVEEKVAHVMEQLRTQKARITFDEKSKTCNITPG